MSSLAIINARILTLAAPNLPPLGPRRGADLKQLGVVERGHIVIDSGRITAVGDGPPPAGTYDARFDARGCVALPAFVDCHTHSCWAGDRYDEFEMKLAGIGYLDILQRGGGIMSTVRAVRNASEDELVDLLLCRLARMAALGTGTVEVKSGYGLTTEDELKMLRAIRRAAALTPQLIVPTFLGAHAIDVDQPDFIERTINETLPAVVQEFPGITCDAYCEEGAWPIDATRRLFENSLDLGCRLRVHADQFHSLGMTRLAVEMGAASVDHLETVTPDDMLHIARSDTIGVMLPCTGFHLDDRYAPGRAFIDAGGALAIASNYNPGSSPTPSMPMTIAFACRMLKITPAEAITAATWNAACVLGLEDEIGSIEPGKRADVQVLDCADERDLGYEFGSAGPQTLILGGRIVHSRAVSAEDLGT